MIYTEMIFRFLTNEKSIFIRQNNMAKANWPKQYIYIVCPHIFNHHKCILKTLHFHWQFFLYMYYLNLHKSHNYSLMKNIAITITLHNLEQYCTKISNMKIHVYDPLRFNRRKKLRVKQVQSSKSNFSFLFINQMRL